MKHEQELKLKPTLKKKIRPAIEDPAMVPMNIYYLIVTYDSKLFKKFMQLSKGLRKHLLFHVFEEVR